MTNYVHNEWLIEGPAAAVDAFEAVALTPPPSGGLRALLRRGPVPARTLDPQRFHPLIAADEVALRDARVAAWGTGRIEAVRYDRAGPERAELEFATPWSHPYGVLAALAQRLPDGLVVRGTYLESGNAYAGRFALRRGAAEDVEEPLVEGFEMLFSGPRAEEE